MSTQDLGDSFKYTYSTEERDELIKIRQKYTKSEETKTERILRLDKKVTQKSTVFSLIAGIIGALIFGFGMSLIMTGIGDVLSLGHTASTAFGIICGICGGMLLALAYPIYIMILKREREKIAPEIIKLTDELLK